MLQAQGVVLQPNPAIRKSQKKMMIQKKKIIAIVLIIFVVGCVWYFGGDLGFGGSGGDGFDDRSSGEVCPTTRIHIHELRTPDGKLTGGTDIYLWY